MRNCTGKNSLTGKNIYQTCNCKFAGWFVGVGCLSKFWKSLLVETTVLTLKSSQELTELESSPLHCTITELLGEDSESSPCNIHKTTTQSLQYIETYTKQVVRQIFDT